MYYRPRLMVLVESHCHIMSDDQRKYPRDLGPKPAAWVRDLTGEIHQRVVVAPPR